MRVFAILVSLTLAGCASARPAVVAPERPVRVVSLDYCADQYVLRLVPRARILAVSPDADADFSYMRAAAKGVRQVRPTAEDVLLLKPDLVVRSYGGGANAGAMFARAGVPVVQLGYADDLAGVRRVLTETADALGEHARGAAMARAFDARLAAVKRDGARRNALYVTPGGVTAGPDTMIDAMFHAAGLTNFQTAPGWGTIPLERLAYATPDVIATAFQDTRWRRPDPWSAAGHPLVRRLSGRPTAALSGASTACGAWFVLDAVEAMARVAR
ncbi:ABC transporter substrate-binding protein [Sphingomonas sp.]|uniref:ABC transporter substrate-binding protein n=1 Tax=Sphingomonas sp. TaxID=28214 RepID=UPI002B965278|nr:ABC transporter substrate-binding protein [Sphingomonas sp.]HWK36304.1 ABC transporter substrate-binding protein [Sphingomonas sp.]